MNNNENMASIPSMPTNQKSNKGIIIVLVILVIGLIGFITYDKLSQNNTTGSGDSNSTEVKDSIKNSKDETEKTTIDKEQVLTDVTKVYEDVFKSISADDMGKDEAYLKTKYGNYFTDKGLYDLYLMFQDQTGSSILSSIFNTTNQGVRTLTIIFADEENALATGIYTASGDNGDSSRFAEYIAFKKVNGTWKIDMFE